MAVVEIHLGSIDVDYTEFARFAELISPEERARAERYRFERDRRRFIIRRGWLRTLLGRHAGQAPEKLVFTFGAYGKPELPGGLCFSQSHSGDRMMIALSDIEVGCDIQKIDEMMDWRPIAESLFSLAERAALAALPEVEGRQAFFECWARKEAFVKAIGHGLSYPLEAFTVSVTPDAQLLAGGGAWSIAALSPGEGYAGAVVVRDRVVTCNSIHVKSLHEL
ncbi:MAG: 4'-phosphopantetheinyl transferase superfamily protein [Sphingomonas sp.]|jgi:4'-phosphopantetheinyl transferase